MIRAAFVAALLVTASTLHAAEEPVGTSAAKSESAAASPRDATITKDVEERKSPRNERSGAAAFQLPDTPAQNAIKQLPKDVVNSPRPLRYSLAEQRDQEEGLRKGIDTITVYGQVDPEDYVSKRSPMLVFRDTLDKTPGPMSPAQKAQAVLCLVGLCGANYGPDGAPVEDKSFSRGERNSRKSLLEQSSQFRGTLQ